MLTSPYKFLFQQDNTDGVSGVGSTDQSSLQDNGGNDPTIMNTAASGMAKLQSGLPVELSEEEETAIMTSSDMIPDPKLRSEVQDFYKKRIAEHKQFVGAVKQVAPVFYINDRRFRDSVSGALTVATTGRQIYGTLGNILSATGKTFTPIFDSPQTQFAYYNSEQTLNTVAPIIAGVDMDGIHAVRTGLNHEIIAPIAEYNSVYNLGKLYVGRPDIGSGEDVTFTDKMVKAGADRLLLGGGNTLIEEAWKAAEDAGYSKDEVKSILLRRDDKGAYLDLRDLPFDERRGKFMESLQTRIDDKVSDAVGIFDFSQDYSDEERSFMANNGLVFEYDPEKKRFYTKSVLMTMGDAYDYSMKYGGASLYRRLMTPGDLVEFNEYATKNFFNRFGSAFVNSAETLLNTVWVAKWNKLSQSSVKKELEKRFEESRAIFEKRRREDPVFAEEYKSFEEFERDQRDLLVKIVTADNSLYYSEAHHTLSWYQGAKLGELSGDLTAQIALTLPLTAGAGAIVRGAGALGARVLASSPKIARLLGFGTQTGARLFQRASEVASKTSKISSRMARSVIGRNLASAYAFSAPYMKKYGAQVLLNPGAYVGGLYAEHLSYVEAREKGLNVDAASTYADFAFYGAWLTEATMGLVSSMSGKMLGLAGREADEFVDAFRKELTNSIGSILERPSAEALVTGAGKSLSKKLVGGIGTGVGAVGRFAGKMYGGYSKFMEKYFLTNVIKESIEEGAQETVEEFVNMFGGEYTEMKYGLSDSTFVYDPDMLFTEVFLATALGSLHVSALSAGLHTLRNRRSWGYNVSKDAQGNLTSMLVKYVVEGKQKGLYDVIREFSKNKMIGVYNKKYALPASLRGKAEDMSKFFEAMMMQQVRIIEEEVKLEKERYKKLNLTKAEIADKVFEAVSNRLKKRTESITEKSLFKLNEEELKQEDGRLEQARADLRQAIDSGDLVRAVLLNNVLANEELAYSELNLANSIVALSERKQKKGGEKRTVVVEHVYSFKGKDYVFNPLTQTWEDYDPSRHKLLKDFDMDAVLSNEDMVKATFGDQSATVMEAMNKVRRLKQKHNAVSLLGLILLAENSDRLLSDQDYVSELLNENVISDFVGSFSTAFEEMKVNEAFKEKLSEDPELNKLYDRLISALREVEAAGNSVPALMAAFKELRNIIFENRNTPFMREIMKRMDALSTSATVASKEVYGLLKTLAGPDDDNDVRGAVNAFKHYAVAKLYNRHLYNNAVTTVLREVMDDKAMFLLGANFDTTSVLSDSLRYMIWLYMERDEPALDTKSVLTLSSKKLLNIEDDDEVINEETSLLLDAAKELVSGLGKEEAAGVPDVDKLKKAIDDYKEAREKLKEARDELYSGAKTHEEVIASLNAFNKAIGNYIASYRALGELINKILDNMPKVEEAYKARKIDEQRAKVRAQIESSIQQEQTAPKENVEATEEATAEPEQATTEEVKAETEEQATQEEEATEEEAKAEVPPAAGEQAPVEEVPAEEAPATEEEAAAESKAPSEEEINALVEETLSALVPNIEEAVTNTKHAFISAVMNIHAVAYPDSVNAYMDGTLLLNEVLNKEKSVAQAIEYAKVFDGFNKIYNVITDTKDKFTRILSSDVLSESVGEFTNKLVARHEQLISKMKLHYVDKPARYMHEFDVLAPFLDDAEKEAVENAFSAYMFILNRDIFEQIVPTDVLERFLNEAEALHKASKFFETLAIALVVSFGSDNSLNKAKGKDNALGDSELAGESGVYIDSMIDDINVMLSFLGSMSKIIEELGDPTLGYMVTQASNLKSFYNGEYEASGFPPHNGPVNYHEKEALIKKAFEKYDQFRSPDKPTLSTLATLSKPIKGREKRHHIPYTSFKKALYNASLALKDTPHLSPEQEYFVYKVLLDVFNPDRSIVHVLQAMAGAGKTTTMLYLMKTLDYLIELGKKEGAPWAKDIKGSFTIQMIVPFGGLYDKLNKTLKEIGFKNLSVKVKLFDLPIKKANESNEAYAKRYVAEYRHFLGTIEKADITIIDEYQVVPVGVIGQVKKLNKAAKVVMSGDLAQAVSLPVYLGETFLSKNEDVDAIPVGTLSHFTEGVSANKPDVLFLPGYTLEPDEETGNISLANSPNILTEPYRLSMRFRSGYSVLSDFLDSLSSKINFYIASGTPFDKDAHEMVSDMLNRAASNDSVKYTYDSSGRIQGLYATNTESDFMEQVIKFVTSVYYGEGGGKSVSIKDDHIFLVSDKTRFREKLSERFSSDVVDSVMRKTYTLSDELKLNGVEIDYVFVDTDAFAGLPDAVENVTQNKMNVILSRAKKGLVILNSGFKGMAKHVNRLSAASARNFKEVKEANLKALAEVWFGGEDATLKMTSSSKTLTSDTSSQADTGEEAKSEGSEETVTAPPPPAPKGDGSGGAAVETGAEGEGSEAGKTSDELDNVEIEKGEDLKEKKLTGVEGEEGETTTEEGTTTEGDSTTEEGAAEEGTNVVEEEPKKKEKRRKKKERKPKESAVVEDGVTGEDKGKAKSSATDTSTETEPEGELGEEKGDETQKKDVIDKAKETLDMRSDFDEAKAKDILNLISKSLKNELTDEELDRLHSYSSLIDGMSETERAILEDTLRSQVRRSRAAVESLLNEAAAQLGVPVDELPSNIKEIVEDSIKKIDDTEKIIDGLCRIK